MYSGIGVAEVFLIALLVGLIIVATQSRRAAIVLCVCFVAISVGVYFYRSADLTVTHHLPSPTAIKSSSLPQIDIGEVVASEVDEEWSDTLAETSELSHGEIDLSTIPEGYPEWVDQTEGTWEPDKKVWSTTVMIGPYETEAECKKHFRKHVHEAAVEFAGWRAAQLTDIGHYDPATVPQPDANLNFLHGTHRRSGDGAYELRTFNRGCVSQTYHTKSNTGVSDEPWPVVFARVELDSDFQREVDRHLLHGRSVGRALRAGTVWGVTLLGMVLALGGLKLTESSGHAAALDTLAAAPANEALPRSTPNESVAHKRVGLLLAPIICTGIFFLVGSGHGFWPKWVWFGCALGFLTTFKPFSELHSKK